MTDGIGNINEVFPEFAGHVFITGVLGCQLHRDSQQVEGIHRHPAGSVGLLDVSTGRQRLAAVKDTDVVETQESALKDVQALGVLAVYPPGEIEREFVEGALQKRSVALALTFFFDLVHAPCRPSVHRRIDIAKGPLIGGNLGCMYHSRSMSVSCSFAKSESTSARGT